MRRLDKYINPVQELVHPLIKDLVQGELAFLRSWLERLVLKNQEAGGTPNAFIFEAEVYSHIPLHERRGLHVEPILSLFVDEARALKEQLAKANRAEMQIKQALSLVASKCRHIQDVRDVLPETLVMAIPELAKLERMRPEGFILSENPLMAKRYNDAIDLLLELQSNKLIR